MISAGKYLGLPIFYHKSKYLVSSLFFTAIGSSRNEAIDNCEKFLMRQI